MQINSRYLVKQRTNIIANLAGFVTEYRPVYQHTIQVYKGIDNVLEFKLLNADQKPINTQNYTPKFKAFDENKNLIIEHDGTILDDGSTLKKGLFTVTITENDLLNVKQQFLSYTIYLVDQNNNNNVITYTDTHFGNDGIIKVSSEAFPGPQQTFEVSSFIKENADTNNWISESIDAQPGINGNEALHTAAIYSNGYIGSIKVQATLDNNVTESTLWADIVSHTFLGSEEQPVPINFNGVFSNLRFVVDNNPADKITKILVRN